MIDDDELARAVARARAAWPEIDAGEDRFRARVAARVAAGDALDQLHVEDLWLATACARGDVRAIAAFDRTILARVPDFVARSGATGAVAADVAQVLRERLLVADGERRPRIEEYAGRGSLAGWVRVAAVRTASNVRRGEKAREPREDAALALPPADPDIELVRRKYGASFTESFRDAFRALEAEERLVLRLQFAEGLSLDDLARALSCSRATAGRRVLAARTRLREETLRLLGERIHATPEELESLLEVVRSKLDLSLGALVTRDA